jgi:hypothetical protein
VPYFPRLRALALFGRRPAQSAERLVVAGVQKTRTRPVIQEWRTHGRIFSFKVGRYPPFVSGSFGSLGKEGGDEIPRAHYDQHCRENEATCDQGGFAFCETVQGQSSSPEIRSWQAARYPHMSGHRFNWAPSPVATRKTRIARVATSTRGEVEALSGWGPLVHSGSLRWTSSWCSHKRRTKNELPNRNQRN